MVDTLTINVIAVGTALLFSSDLFSQIATGAVVAAASTVAKLVVQHVWRRWQARQSENAHKPAQLEETDEI